MKFFRYLLPLLLTALIAEGASAQQRFKIRTPLRENGARGIPGEVRVKVTRDAFARHASIELFGETGGRYGIYDMTSWIDPNLLDFKTPLLKMSSEGAPSETPSHSIARIMVVRYSALDAPEDVALALSRIPGIEYAEISPRRELLFTPNDPLLPQQPYLDQIRAREAWDLIRGDSTIIIAITDSGIERQHGDLKDAVWTNPGETGKDDQGDDRATNGVDDDHNGYVDDWWGWDFSGSNGSNPDNDPSGIGEEHGTHVTGIAAASGNNALGIAGVAFGVKVMAVKITTDQPGPSFHNEMNGVMYAAKMGAKVINCSWGGITSSRAEQEVFHMVVHDMGVVVVAAAGNNGIDEKYYPASYDGVLSVGAVRSDDSRWDSSDFNYRVDISAPGDAIYSTVLGSSYGYLSGTSMATPMVSAAAALVRLRYPLLNAEQVGAQLRATADELSTTVDPAHLEKVGTGRVNVRRAIEADPISTSSARMVNYTVIDAGGDGAIDAGEAVRIRIDVRNILGSAANVTARLSIVSGPPVTLPSATMNFGPMITGQTLTSADSVFTFTVPPSTPANTEIMVKVAVETPDRANNDYFMLNLAPTYMTTDLNEIVSTFNSVGNIAYDGTDHDHGDGFNYLDNENVLFHGGLMIGTGPDHLSDVVRTGGLFSDPADGFHATQLYRLRTLPDSSVQIGTARFNDAHLGPAGVGVDVAMETYEYRDSASSNIVIVVYRLTNTNTTPLNGLRCGLFLDWDVSGSGFDDQAGFDPAYKLGYARDASGGSGYYMGTALLTAQDAGFYAVDNGADGFNPATAPQQKWTMMSSGIHENPTIDDMSMVMSAGPISIAAGATTDVAFALIGAPGFAALRGAATHAGDLFGPSSVPGSAPTASMLSATLSPNPFGERGSIGFTMPAPGQATVTLYDLRGEALGTIFEGRLDAGRQSVPFAGDDLPEGAYIYEIRAGGLVERGKAMKLRP